VSDDTPRERIVLDPGEVCPDCGGDLRLLGEDVSEILELITAKLKVVEIARLKKSCRRCEKITQPSAPSRPIPRSMVGPGLLAHILVSKFDDHLSLYRQNEIFARMGAYIPSSTLVDWCGQGMRVSKITKSTGSTNCCPGTGSRKAFRQPPPPETRPLPAAYFFLVAWAREVNVICLGIGGLLGRSIRACQITQTCRGFSEVP